MIYFVQDSLTFRIKIGFTGKDDVKARLKELQTGSSSLLYLLATREGTKATEGELHQQFATYRQVGEWFDPGPLLINYIVGCASVDMCKQAIQTATVQIVEQSFPETVEEEQRREKAKKAEKWAKLMETARQLIEQDKAKPTPEITISPGYDPYGCGPPHWILHWPQELNDEFGFEGVGRAIIGILSEGKPPPQIPYYVAGDRVLHSSYGYGRVQEVSDAKVIVNFGRVGERVFVRNAKIGSVLERCG